jgi:hypothetical protein
MSVEPSQALDSVPQGKSLSRPLYVYNSGDAPLIVAGITRSAGSAEFTLDASATFPVTLKPGGTKTFRLVFAPSRVGGQAATLDIASNDARSPYRLAVSGRGIGKESGGDRRSLVPPEGFFGSGILRRSALGESRTIRKLAVGLGMRRSWENADHIRSDGRGSVLDH